MSKTRLLQELEFHLTILLEDIILVEILIGYFNFQIHHHLVQVLQRQAVCLQVALSVHHLHFHLQYRLVVVNLLLHLSVQAVVQVYPQAHQQVFLHHHPNRLPFLHLSQNLCLLALVFLHPPLLVQALPSRHQAVHRLRSQNQLQLPLALVHLGR